VEEVEDAIRASVRSEPPLLAAGDRVLVAVSGGPDSMCLLHALLALQGEIGLGAVEAAHLDHGLRGAESAADAAAVAAFCAERAVNCVLGAADVAGRADRDRLSIQEAAREERYAFLERAAADRGMNKIATAHTRDDQVETVLLNAIRGSGLDGLRGMPAVNGARVRPLLSVGRDAVEAYCARHGIAARTDASNADPDHYARNRIRLEVLPALRRSHPGADRSILRLARTAGSAAEHIRAEAVSALEALSVVTRTGGLEIDAGRLVALHPALQSAVVREAIVRLRGSTAQITESHIDLVRSLLVAEVRGGLTTPSPTVMIRGDRRSLTLERRDTGPLGAIESVILPAPGDVRDPLGLWWISAGRGGQDASPSGGLVHEVTIDPTRIDAGGLVVRSRRAGDRIDPVGLRGKHRKLQDLFVDGRVPQPRRDGYPIVCDPWGPIWVPGLALANRAVALDPARSALALCAWISGDLLAR
jgi:tRNA(Ile)-lysidine synthase